MVPKSLPPSATSKTQTSQTLVPGMLGPCSSQFPCPRPSPLPYNGPQVTPSHPHIQMFSLPSPFVRTLPKCRSRTPAGIPPAPHTPPPLRLLLPAGGHQNPETWHLRTGDWGSQLNWACSAA